MRAIIDLAVAEEALRWHSSDNRLGVVHSKVAGDSIILESSSDTMWRRSVLPARDTEDGEVRFSLARIMLQLKTVLKATELRIEAPNKGRGNVVTTVGRSTSSTPIMADISTFWRPATQPEEIAEVGADDLKWAFRAARTAAANPNATGGEAYKSVLVTIQDSRLSTVATDAYRLAFATVECMASKDEEFRVIPDPFIKSLLLMGDPVVVIRQGGHLGVKGDRHMALMTSLDVQAPATGKVISKAKMNPHAVTMEVAELKAALKGMATDMDGKITMNFFHDYVVLANASSASNAVGRTEIEVEASVNMELVDTQVGVNSNFLTSLLDAVRTPKIEMRLLAQKGIMMTLLEFEGSKSDTDFVGVLSLSKATK